MDHLEDERAPLALPMCSTKVDSDPLAAARRAQVPVGSAGMDDSPAFTTRDDWEWSVRWGAIEPVAVIADR